MLRYWDINQYNSYAVWIIDFKQPYPARTTVQVSGLLKVCPLFGFIFYLPSICPCLELDPEARFHWISFVRQKTAADSSSWTLRRELAWSWRLLRCVTTARWRRGRVVPAIKPPLKGIPRAAFLESTQTALLFASCNGHTNNFEAAFDWLARFQHPNILDTLLFSLDSPSFSLEMV